MFLSQQITRHPELIVTKLLKNSGFARTVQQNPNATSYIYDTLALAYLVDPSYATDVAEMWVDVDITWGPSYGHTVGYREQHMLPGNYLQEVQGGSPLRQRSVLQALRRSHDAPGAGAPAEVGRVGQVGWLGRVATRRAARCRGAR